MEERLNKPTGLGKFLEQFDITKNDTREELEKFWKIYSRVFKESKEIISKIYINYFEREAEAMLELMEKGMEFINAAVVLNKKNKEIVNILGNMLDFDRIRVESI